MGPVVSHKQTEGGCADLTDVTLADEYRYYVSYVVCLVYMMRLCAQTACTPNCYVMALRRDPRT